MVVVSFVMVVFFGGVYYTMNHLLLFSVIIQEIEKMIVQNPDFLHIENHCGLCLNDQITRAPATSQCSNKPEQ